MQQEWLLMNVQAAHMLPSADVIDTVELSERRQMAFKRAQRHSQIVVILRKVFPVLAVICVVAYFLTGEFSIQFKDMKASVQKIELTKNELKMTNPRLEGHDEKAGSYVVTADTATQKADSPYVINLQVIKGTIEHPSNGAIKLQANEGVFDTKNELLDLKGDIVVRSANGMVARLSDAHIIFKKQDIKSSNPVQVEMNSSSIRADSVHMDGISKTLVFQDNVRARILKNPTKTEAKEDAIQGLLEKSGDIVKTEGPAQ